ncbi:DUF5677 domain-containing protein [Halodesulfurarchaeum sp. HSR-GB]|uniref:DUF5677 domain-containing protein n=1 Tax=Halodesulfurarchaeum sp. HSR-GB TaxID=3074077 RepID=UPI002858275D|nr:DUF5677 domain-containing protein [Halodesulfurarchaeum sp. HSR-GB]MDR5657698.1 DUF5677 domain-containing protein [Halodesulfurarchaeum sp. HSR-GB]
MPPNDSDPFLKAIKDQFRQTIQEEDVEEDITQDDIADATSEVINSLGEDMYHQVRDNDEGLRRLHETKAEFESGIEQRWGVPLELLERFIVWSQETGEAINSEHRLQAAEKQDFAFDALTRLHARAVQVSMEIHNLLKGGFADGAFARWRSLHEISITASFIKQAGTDTAKRFLHYRYLWEYYFAQTYQDHAEELGDDEVEDEIIESLKEGKDELVDRFGSDFDDNGYGTGWAAEAYDGSGGPSIRDLQDAVDLGHYQPYYRLASESVHGGSKGTLDRLGLLNIPDMEQPDLLLAGPSNAGLSRPGQLTALSLAQITFAFINYQSSTVHVAEMKGMQRLVDDITESFAEVSVELEQDERDSLEEWADQDIIDIALNYIGAPALFTDEVVRGHTDFDSRAELEQALSVLLEEMTDVDELPEEVDETVTNNSEYDSLENLIDVAFEEWVRREVDLSEFDID